MVYIRATCQREYKQKTSISFECHAGGQVGIRFVAEIATVPDGKQPDHLTPEVLHLLLKK